GWCPRVRFATLLLLHSAPDSGPSRFEARTGSSRAFRTSRGVSPRKTRPAHTAPCSPRLPTPGAGCGTTRPFLGGQAGVQGAEHSGLQHFMLFELLAAVVHDLEITIEVGARRHGHAHDLDVVEQVLREARQHGF